MINVGVIGLGYWGPNLVRNFKSAPGCHLTAVADRSPESLEAVAKNYPGLSVYPSGEKMIQGPGLDAVAIATPVSTHFELAKQALLQGKHVLVEKPLAMTARQGEELMELAHHHKLVLMVGHTYVYSGLVRLIKRLVDDGELGDVWYYDSIRANLGRWQPDVNVIWDLAPHDLSILAYILPQPPRTVSATAACSMGWGHHAQECMAYVTLSWPSGLLGHLHLSWLSPVKIRRIVVGGSRKTLVHDPMVSPEVHLYDKGMEVEETARYHQGEPKSLPVDAQEPLAVECGHFLECIRNGSEPLTDGRHGLRVLQLIEAAQASSKAGGQPVEVLPS